MAAAAGSSDSETTTHNVKVDGAEVGGEVERREREREGEREGHAPLPLFLLLAPRLRLSRLEREPLFVLEAEFPKRF